MQKFGKRLVRGFMLLAGLHFLVNGIAFLVFVHQLPETRCSLLIYRDPDAIKISPSERTLIIGCSNIEHNLDIAKIRSETKGVVDIFQFNGSAPFNYIEYLIDKKVLVLDDYSKVIYYLPYNCYEQSATFQHRRGFYELFASKDYVYYLVRKAPYLLLSESWIMNCKEAISKEAMIKSVVKREKVKGLFRTIDETEDGLTNELMKEGSSYRMCNYPFVRNRFPFKVEPSIVYGLPSNYKGKIFLPPVPKTVDFTPFKLKQNGRILNSYQSALKDTQLFYDQSYHLNYCGRIIETNEMIEAINKW